MFSVKMCLNTTLTNASIFQVDDLKLIVQMRPGFEETVDPVCVTNIALE